MERAASGQGGEAAHLRSDVSEDAAFRGYVRKEEYWHEDSPEYKAGNDIQNRKRPPPDEVPGDIFDRQRVMCGFDQGLIERQSCLVLGAGGIGQNVALTLARLGVGKIVLVDRDIYDASNLTRQCLGGKSDVGRPKVEVAAQMLREHHGLRCQVETLHLDVLLDWPRVVAAAREATIVFNGIDIGPMWDYCVNSLCKELGVPLACGQSFAWKFMTEFYTSAPEHVCSACSESPVSVFGATAPQVGRAGGIRDRLQAFVAATGGVDARGDTRLDEECLVVFLCHDKQFLCTESPLMRDVVAVALARAGLGALGPEDGLHGWSLSTPGLLAFLRSFCAEATERLLPGSISSLPHLTFIPRPAHVDTRFIGSWVCPCLACAVMMVSQWCAWLTSDPPEEGGILQERNIPQSITFNLDTGMTSEEQLGYELGALGMPPSKDDRVFCRQASKSSCLVCQRAAQLQAEESLFVGRLPVVLAPAPGEATAPPASWLEPPKEGDERRAAATAIALKRRRPLEDLGVEYKDAVVPAMPALDWERGLPGLPSLGRAVAAEATWPAELATLPLLKVPAGAEAARAPSALRGVASGVRSALVKARGRWWRLKGCGQRDQGFPVETKGDRGEQNVRGCCFQHTAYTELRMTTLAAEALAAAGLDSANEPAGCYRYVSDPEWALPKIERYCAVFATLGNMRLGDHLLAGLARLLPYVALVPADGFASLRTALAVGRGAEDPSDLWPTSLLVSCGMPAADAARQLGVAGVMLEEAVPPSAGDLRAAAPAVAPPSELDAVFDTLACLAPRLGVRRGLAGAAQCWNYLGHVPRRDGHPL